MKIITHVFKQPFIFTTGLAALIHSTWSLGTLFAGEQPEAALDIHFLGWLAPALLIAFALDVGQIATSAEIRAGQRTRVKYLTFIIFAGATYYLQWLYIAHHMPSLDLAGGVRQEWAWFATLIRDAAVWVIPAFLPLSTTLYTISSGQPGQQESITPMPPFDQPPVSVEPLFADVSPLLALERGEDAQTVADEDTQEYIANCVCGWSGSYKTERGATNAHNAHSKTCAVFNMPRMSENGHQTS